MSPQTNVRIWWDASIDAYRLSSSFDKQLVDALKTHIPGSDRSYDPQSKIWTFVEKYLDPIRKILVLMGITPVVITRAQTTQASSSTSSGSTSKRSIDAVMLEFLRVLPYNAALKAYRTAAMELHPDRGGSMEKMSSLNAAWERISKEVYNQ